MYMDSIYAVLLCRGSLILVVPKLLLQVCSGSYDKDAPLLWGIPIFARHGVGDSIYTC